MSFPCFFGSLLPAEYFFFLNIFYPTPFRAADVFRTPLSIYVAPFLECRLYDLFSAHKAQVPFFDLFFHDVALEESPLPSRSPPPGPPPRFPPPAPLWGPPQCGIHPNVGLVRRFRLPLVLFCDQGSPLAHFSGNLFNTFVAQ